MIKYKYSVSSEDPSSGLLHGKSVFVTGASGAIGEAIGAAMEAQGAIVHRTDRTSTEGVVAMDATDEAAIRAGFDVTGPITDVVHAVGQLIVGPLATTSLADFTEAMGANLTSAFLIGREAARRLEAGGSLTFVASQAGFRGGANWGVYCAMKAGVMRLAEALAQELGPRGVRVNSVCPGSVDTPMLNDACEHLAGLTGVSTADITARYRETIPMGRVATAAEVADVCVFLVSPLARYVSGTSIPVDGGEVSA